MTSGKLTPKPSDTFRKSLDKRAQEHVALVNKVTPDRLLKSPSQKKSEAARKREQKRAGRYADSCRAEANDIVFDCYTCPRKPCGNNPMACDVDMVLERCSKCGKPTRHYADKSWRYCMKCRDVNE